MSNPHGDHSLGGFRGNARKGQQRWNQKGANRASRKPVKSCAVAALAMGGAVLSVVGAVVRQIVS